MSYLSGFAKAFSPSKGTPAPKTPLRATSPTLSHLKRESMSPLIRTEKWLAGPTPKEDPNKATLRKVKTGRVNKIIQKGKKRKSIWDLPLLSAFFGDSRREQDKENLEGDTLVEEQEPAPSKDEPVEDHNEELEKASPGRIYNKRYFDYDDPRVNDWAFEEIWLFNKMQRRAHEPLLPYAWALDFPSFPDSLFSKVDQRVFIKNIHCTIPHACGALNALIQSGPRCRDNILFKLNPERSLSRGIQAYIKWSLMDGGLAYKPHIPLTTISAARPSEPVQRVVDRVTTQLYALGDQYRTKWRHPDCKISDSKQIYTHNLPTLYGFVVISSVVAVVTNDSSVKGKPVRTLATYDFKHLGQDVWNALAIGIVVVKARNYLLQLEKEGEIGEEVIDEEDPDA